MLHDRAELRWLHEAVNPTTASCRSWEASFVLSEVDDTSILRTGLPTPSQLPAQLVRIGDSLGSNSQRATRSAAPQKSVAGTELPTSALQRFRPESEGQLTCGERDGEDRS